MAINKLQRSRLTFDLSAKVLILESIIIYLNKIFSETIGPIELKFHMKISYNKLTKIYAN